MKVSEAVERMQVSPIVDDGLCIVTHRDLATLLASHEALRLAGEAVSEEPYNPSGIADLGTIVVSRKEYDALSLAVEDASK